MITHDSLALFPSKEEWGTGDEAMDNKLSIAIKKVFENLSIESITEFYYFGLAQKPRAYNPAFYVTIELVTKALLSLESPESFINHQMLKLKGHYHLKQKVSFDFSERDEVLKELLAKKMCRYKGQIDFYYGIHSSVERNPFVQYGLTNSAYDFHVKIVMKDFRSYLNGEKPETSYDDALFRALRTSGQILFIEHFAELWYHEGQIFSLPHF